MRPVVRCIAIALLAPALLPGSALADARLEVDGSVDLLRITGNDNGAADRITIVQNASTYTITRDGGDLLSLTCTPVVAQTSYTCPRRPSLTIDLGTGDDTLITSGVTDRISVFGGDDDDFLTGGSGADTLAGGDGDDTLEGRSGVDDYFGQDGDDFLDTVDGEAERLSCGAGDDTVQNDFTDILAECERGVDRDGDNFNSRVDCNDAAPAIFPGARETFENGVDEDCDGRDNVNLDRDADGFPAPADCNDANAAIRPGALEVRGNTVDENCDSRAEPFALLRALVLNNWSVDGRRTKLRLMVVRNAPAGARVVFRCTGASCPSTRAVTKTVPRDLAPVRLDDRRLRRATLRPGAKLSVQITAAETTGRTFTYSVKNGEIPTWTVVCRSPTESRSRAC